LVRDDESLFVERLHRERCAATGSQRRMRALDRRLEILRIVIYASDDYEVFESTCYKEFAVADESQVTRSQERPFTAVRNVGFEDLSGLINAIPVAPGHAGTADPYLAGVSGLAFDKGDRIDDR